MALDFPTSPTNGQKFPASPIAGVPTYTWDSEKWTTQSDAIGNLYVAKSGDSMTGALALPGNPSTALQAAPKQYVDTFAAPIDALAYSGMQINGGMEVSQENGIGTQLSVSGANKYIADGWYVSSVGTQVMNIIIQGAGLSGFTQRLATWPATANAAPAVGHYCVVVQRIEGYRISRMGWGTANAQPLTVSFWVMAVRPGAYSGSVINGASNRSYAFSFTVNVTNTFEYKTVTIPGDTTGTWAIDNTIGLQLYFTAMSGSTYTTTANVWTAGYFFGVTGTVNGVAALTDTFFITGVTVHPGTQAPSAARSPFIMRPYDQEFTTCQRYLERGLSPSYYLGTIAGIGYVIDNLLFKVRKRAAATITIPNAWNYYSNGTAAALPAGVSFTADDVRMGFLYNGYVNWNGWFAGGTWQADARL